MVNIKKIEYKNDKEYIEEFMSLAISSSTIQHIEVPSEKKIRGQIHIILYGEVCATKSTILKDISDFQKDAVTSSLTKATLLGSIDKNTQEFILPISYIKRNKCLLYDEVDFDVRKSSDKELLDVLNKLMEHSTVEKPMGYKGKEYMTVDEKDKSLYFSIQKSGVIKFVTRNSYIFATMFDPFKTKSPTIQAFNSRCIILKYFPSIIELRSKIFNKNSNLKFKRYKVNKFYKPSKKDCEYITNYLEEKKFEEHTYLRTFGDCLRIFCIKNFHDISLYDYIIDMNLSLVDFTNKKKYYSNDIEKTSFFSKSNVLE